MTLTALLTALQCCVDSPCVTLGKDLREAAVSWRDVFVEVPIKVHNSSLAQALIADINPAAGATAADLERLNLGSAPYISKTMGSLIDCLDDLVAEQQKVRTQGTRGGSCEGAGTWQGQLGEPTCRQCEANSSNACSGGGLSASKMSGRT